MRKLFLIFLLSITVPYSAQAQQLDLLVEIPYRGVDHHPPGYAGWGLELLGDINNDGYEDIVIMLNSNHSNYPGTMIVNGRTGGELAYLSLTDDIMGFRDFDRDGIDELIIINGGLVRVFKWVDAPVPVTLSLFSAERLQEDVAIRWEVNEFVFSQVEFRVFRGNMEITRSPLSGNKSYEFIDENAPRGEINYFLEETDASGARRRHGPIKIGSAPVKPMNLTAHPNPFNPSVNISYTVPQRGLVSLEVYDVQGKLVENLLHIEPREPNQYEITYKPEKASGIYFVRLQVGGQVKTMKIVLLK